MHQHRVIESWKLDLAGEDAAIIQATDWDLVETTLLRCDYFPCVTLASQNEGGFRWLVKAVTQGSIFARFARVGKLKLIWERPEIFEIVDILATRSSYTIDGAFVALDPLERFELRLHEYSGGDVDSYLRVILEKRNGDIQDPSSSS